VGVETTALTAITVVATIDLEPENLRMVISFALRYVRHESECGYGNDRIGLRPECKLRAKAGASFSLQRASASKPATTSGYFTATYLSLIFNGCR
jgi:hypothetical protein